MLRKQAGLFRKTKRVRKAFAERTLFLYAKATIYTMLTQLAAKRGRKSRKKYIKILKKGIAFWLKVLYSSSMKTIK